MDVGGGVILLVIIGVGVYFLPTFVAENRNTHNRGGVLLLNFLTGWTLIGWFVALVMACGSRTVTADKPVVRWKMIAIIPAIFLVIVAAILIRWIYIVSSNDKPEVMIIEKAAPARHR